MILEIECTFPGGQFHGEEWEWPPAPARMFQALVAGTHRGAHGLIHQETRDAALRWLETLPPPVILAVSATFGNTHVENYVPDNDGKAEHIRTTAKSLAAHGFPAGSAVAYRWTFDPAGPDASRHADVAAAMASLVTYLGRTTDGVFARGRVLPESAAADEGRICYFPRETPGGAWPAPSGGFFDLCRERYPRSVSTQPPDDTNSTQVDYAPAAGVIPAAVPVAIFQLLKPDGEQLLSFDPQDVRQPSGLVRGALLAWAARPYIGRAFGADMVARLLAGHQAADTRAPSGNNGHFGVIPLPSLNQAAKADGDLRRVALVGWGARTPEEHELFREAVLGLHGAPLLDNGKLRGRLGRCQGGEAARWRSFLTGPARRWRSATPVVLPGQLRRGRPAESLVARALVQAGHALDSIASVAAFTGPLIPHTLRARDYRVGDYLDTTPRRQVEVLFHRPMAGPIVLGRGRYAGVGLCLPWREVGTGRGGST